MRTVCHHFQALIWKCTGSNWERLEKSCLGANCAIHTIMLRYSPNIIKPTTHCQEWRKVKTSFRVGYNQVGNWEQHLLKDTIWKPMKVGWNRITLLAYVTYYIHWGGEGTWNENILSFKTNSEINILIMKSISVHRFLFL